jgi:hypothetical protein
MTAMAKLTTRPDPRLQQRALTMCADLVRQKGGAINFDSMYRSLVEQGIDPNTAHLAVEKYTHDAMMKRTRKP